MSIIKRRKTVQYLQLNNFPVQEDLDDLSAIGLLTYVMSLPEDWVLHKTQLQSTFSRRKVDGAWKILAEKKYAIGFICYLDGKKTYHYNVSDISFTEEEYLQFVDDALKELLEKGHQIRSIKEMPDNAYIIPDLSTTVQNVQQSEITTAQNVQYSMYSTISTVQNVQIQNKYNTKKQEQKNKNKENIKIDNYQGPIINSLNPDEFKSLLTNSCNNFYPTFAPGRWNKKDWSTIIEKFVSETVESGRYKNVPQDKIEGYAFVSIRNMTEHNTYKHSEEFAEYQESMKELAARAPLFNDDDLPF
ncbi:hypothetical protein NST55_28595 [Bacillus sp. FSL R10-2789]|uniref:hypothetical protein n=1 Tax=Bacillus sp. FSL R10-2789 TaxID=2954662 RepID=UPI0030F6773E